MTEPLLLAIDVRPGRIVLATVHRHRVIDTRRLEREGCDDAARTAAGIALLRERAPGPIVGLAGVWRPEARLGLADPRGFIALLEDVGARTALPTSWLPHGAALALGEWSRSQVEGPLAALALDVGVAGGVVLDGRAFAPLRLDLGHVSVDPDGLKCACGGRGCLHTYASETAMQLLARDVESSLELPSPADRQQVMGSHLAARQAEKVRSTHVLIARAGRAIGLAAGHLAEAFGVVEVRIRGRHPDQWRVLSATAAKVAADVYGERAPRLVAAESSEDAFFVGAVAAHS